MRKIVLVTLLVLLVVFPVSAASRKVPAEWTVMVYLDADNDLFFPCAVMDVLSMERIGSSPEVNVLVEFDGITGYNGNGDNTWVEDWSETFIFYVTKNPATTDADIGTYVETITEPLSPVVAELGERNMGDPQTLVEFVTWAMGNYPANNYMLVVWDHGSGWKSANITRQPQSFPFPAPPPMALGSNVPPTFTGICWDWTNGDDYLTMPELREALSQIKTSTGKKIQLLYLYACMMGMTEVAYDIKDYVDVMVATEEVGWAPQGWDYYLKYIVDMAATSPEEATPDKVGAEIVQKYIYFYESLGLIDEHQIPMTMSATDLTRLDVLSNALNGLAEKLDEKLSIFKVEIKQGRTGSQTYTDTDYRDLYHFASLIRALVDDTEIQAAAQVVMEAIKGVVIAEDHAGPGVDNSNGLSIYIPEDVLTWMPRYKTDLIMSYVLGWDDFVEYYLRAFSDIKAPTISMITPTITENPQPLLIFLLSDGEEGSGINKYSIRMKLDGELVIADELANIDYDPVTQIGYDAQRGRLNYKPPSSLAVNASHSVVIKASDIAGNSTGEVVFNFLIVEKKLPAGISMFSVPYQLDSTDPTKFILTTPLRMAKWDPMMKTYKYLYYPPASALGVAEFPLLPGRAYWLYIDTPSPIDVKGDYLDLMDSFSVDVKGSEEMGKGWNMVGNPFPFAIFWNSVRVSRLGVEKDLGEAIDAGWVKPLLYWYTPTGYKWAAPDGVLEPWQGYWVRVLKDCSLIFPALPVTREVSKSAALPKAAKGGAGDWYVQLSVQADNANDLYNFFGVAKGAADGYDLGDVEEPPMAPSGLSLRFVHTDWGKDCGYYAKDVRAAGGGAKSWGFEVEDNLPEGVPVNISWGNLSGVPKHLKLTLMDLDGGRQCYMRTSNCYTYNTSKLSKVRHFKLLVEPAIVGDLKISNITVTPFRGMGTTITYNLSKDALVDVEIYSLSGKLVRKLAKGKLVKAGMDEIDWDGNDQAGKPVVCGAYLCQVKAVTEEGQLAKAMRPIIVVK